MNYTKLSIIIPVYTEEKTIEHLLSKVVLAKTPIEKEVIYVDDGSKDNTLNVLKK